LYPLGNLLSLKESLHTSYLALVPVFGEGKGKVDEKKNLKNLFFKENWKIGKQRAPYK